MSDTSLGTATYKINGDSAGAVNAANQANNALARLEQVVATNWWGLQNLGLAFAALPGAVAAGVGVAVKYASQWEDAMLGVERTTGLQGEALQELETELKSIAGLRPVASVEIAGVAEAAGALGILEQDIGRFTKAVVDFSSLTGMTTTAAATGLARIAALTDVSAGGFENLASSIYKVGVNTAATEEEIIAIGTRLAGTASAVGLTADQLVGLSAAVRSAGIRSEMGATAIQKSFFDMNNAITENGDNLQRWASLAGTSAQNFAEQFRGGGAMQMFLQVITNMGEMASSGQDVIRILTDLGITEARQQQALLVMAQAQDQTANSNARLSSALEYAREGMLDTTSALEMADRRAQTFSGQTQILKNNLFALGASVDSLLGWATGIVGFFADFVRGISAIPAPIRTSIMVFGLFATALSGILALLILVGPRLIIAGGAFKQIIAAVRGMDPAAKGAAAAMASTSGAAASAGNAADQMRVKYVQLRNELGHFAGTKRVLIAATNAENAALARQGTILAGLRGFWAANRAAILRTVSAMGALIASTILLTIWTARQGDAAEQAARQREQANAEAKRALIIGIEDETKGQRGAAQAALATIPAYQKAKQATEELGLSHETLDRIIKGNVSHREFDEWLTTVVEAEENGSASARELRQSVQDLYASYTGAESVLGVTGDSMADFATSTDAATDAVKDNSEALQENYDRLSGIAQAHLDYISAQFAAREAAFSLKDAEEELAEARRNVADPTEAIAELEREIQRARRDQASAADDVAKAERDLSRARQQGRDDLADAEDQLFDARNDYLNGLLKIAEMEEELNDLRAGPTMEQLTKATNDLRDAQLALVASYQTVADAEWYLQHLREEGASARDISDAEFALASARAESANAQEDLTEAEKALADLTDPAARAEAIAKAERDLAAARRESLADLREIRQSEQELADIRAAVANDTYYKDALANLADARDRERDAIRSVRDAEAELQALQAKGAQDELARAQLRYEMALYRVAEANVEVARQQAAMRGEMWDAGDVAHALADQLSILAASAPDEASRKRLQDFIDTLRNTPDVPTAPKSKANTEDLDIGGAGLSPEDLGGLIGGGEPLDFGQMAEDLFGDDNGWKQALLPIGVMIIGQLIASLLVAALGAVTMAGLVAALPFIIIGAIIAGIVALFMNDEFREDFLRGVDRIWQWIKDWAGTLKEKSWELKNNFFEMAGEFITGLWDGFTAKAGEVLSGIGDWLYDRIVRPIKETFGIHSPSTVFSEIGGDLIDGFWNGIKVAWAIGSAWLGNIKSTVTGAVSGAWDWLYETGRDIIRGLKNGITNAITGLGNTVRDLASTYVVDPVKRLFRIDSPSKLFHYFGEMVGEGLAEGITQGSGAALDASKAMVQQAAQAANADLRGQLGSFGIDYLLGPNGVGTLQLDAAAVKNMALDRPVVNNYETLDLDAITTADPTEIMNEYVWAKRVRMRGAG